MNLAIEPMRTGRGKSACYPDAMPEPAPEYAVWGPYPNYQDIARLEYGRRMWRLPEMRERLIAHWTDDRHPYAQRFKARRLEIEEVLSSSGSAFELDQQLRARGTSLRCLTREIPPVFGSFFAPPVKPQSGQPPDRSTP